MFKCCDFIFFWEAIKEDYIKEKDLWGGGEAFADELIDNQTELV